MGSGNKCTENMRVCRKNARQFSYLDSLNAEVHSPVKVRGDKLCTLGQYIRAIDH